MRRTYLIHLLIFIILSSCGSKPIRKNPKYNNLTQWELIEIIGNPKELDTLKLTVNKSLMEYQSDLYDIMSGMNAEDTIIVKEFYWKENDKNIVVWFIEDERNKWVSFDNLIWTKEIEF